VEDKGTKKSIYRKENLQIAFSCNTHGRKCTRRYRVWIQL